MHNVYSTPKRRIVGAFNRVVSSSENSEEEMDYEASQESEVIAHDELIELAVSSEHNHS